MVVGHHLFNFVMIGNSKKPRSPWQKNKYLKGPKFGRSPKLFYRKKPRNISSNRILFLFSLAVLGGFWLYENPEYITSKLSGFPSSDTRPLQNKNILEGKITHVRDGDTFEVVGKAVRIAALDCPENSNPEGKRVTKFAQRFQGQYAVCGLTGATTYDRVVGYCKINGVDFGKTMMDNTSCKLWKKYDVWNRY